MRPVVGFGLLLFCSAVASVALTVSVVRCATRVGRMVDEYRARTAKREACFDACARFAERVADPMPAFEACGRGCQ